MQRDVHTSPKKAQIGSVYTCIFTTNKISTLLIVLPNIIGLRDSPSAKVGQCQDLPSGVIIVELQVIPLPGIVHDVVTIAPILEHNKVR